VTNRLNKLLDFFLPRFCFSCNSKLNNDQIILCNTCSGEIHQADQIRLQHEFIRKFADENIISGFTSAFVFEKDKALQHLIHALKYNENFRIGIYLGKKVAQLCKDTIMQWNADYLIPIPLHHLKKAERGYNQSFYIAKGIGSVLKIKINHNSIKRIRYTGTQTELSLTERRDNIKDAFKIINAKSIKSKNIILVDDVITTGATILECSKILLMNGAAKIFALSAAIAD
jgi:ComF family protein